MKKNHLKILLLLSLCTFNSLAVFAQKQTEKPVVGVHIIDYTSDAGLERLAEDLPAYAAKGVNLMVLEVDYNFEFKSHPELRQSDQLITFNGARKFSNLCKQYGIKLVPEFQSLGHQSWDKYTYALLTKYPELDLTPGAFPNNEGIYCRAWDPMNPKVNQIVFPLIDEILDAFQADGLHMGMDEVFLIGSEKSPSTFGKNPAEVYAKVVNDFHAHFSPKKVSLYMWGDRLIDGVKYPYGEWESSLNGTAPAIDLIPKDIIICDWHYESMESYPSIPMFIEKGFKVLPCSFKNVKAATDLIKYSLRQQNPAMLGHMFTSWSNVPKDSLLVYPAFVQGLNVLKNKLIWDVAINEKNVNADGTVDVSLITDKKGTEIFYTTDGKKPDRSSAKYTGTVHLTKSAKLSAVAYQGALAVGEVSSKDFVLHKATGKQVSLRNQYSSNYPPKTGSASILVNGIEGTPSFADGQWLGFNGEDIEVTLNLGAEQELSSVSFLTYNDPIAWVYPGEKAEIWLSKDGKNFVKVAEAKLAQKGVGLNVSSALAFQKQKASYVRLIIPKRVIPADGHVAAGQPAWIFIDEIVVK